VKCLATATRIDFLVAFLMISGVDLLAASLEDAVNRGVPVRIVCGDTLGITQPAALYRLRTLLGDKVSLRFYREPSIHQQIAQQNQSQAAPRPRSFHPKAWFFHEDDHTTLFLGSSNASRSALLDGVEWNVRLDSRTDPQTVATFQAEFEHLYRHCSVEIDDVMLRRYSLRYRKPERHAPFDPPYDPPYDPAVDVAVVPLLQEPFPDPAAKPALKSEPGQDPKPGAGQEAESEMVRVSEREGTPEVAHTSGLIAAANKRLPVAFPTPQPNDPQTEALYALRRTRELGNGKALVVAATGVGKTFLAAFDSVGFPRVLFLAHREELLTQAQQAFRQVRPMDETGFYTGERKDPRAVLLFASVQTLGKAETLAQADFPQDRFDYVVIDEFHHAAADSYRRVLAHFQPRFLLGLTATPDRMDNREVFSLCDYNVVYDVRLKEAIEKGWLSPFHYYGVADETVRYDTIRFLNGRYDGEQLEAALSIPKRAELVLQHYRRFPARRCLAFCAGRRHAAWMAHVFQNNGIQACAVMSDTSGIPHAETVMDRTDALAQLKDGRMQVVFAVDMLNEGVDVPAVDLLLFLRPTESATVFLQQLGRGLRKAQGKSHVTVLDFIGNYRNVALIPRLLRGTGEGMALEPGKRNARTGLQASPEAYPEGCHVQFDWDVIDLFQRLERQHTGAKVGELAGLEYDRIAEYLGHPPSLVEYDTWLSDAVRERIKGRQAQEHPLKDWIGFLAGHQVLAAVDPGVADLLGTVAHSFLAMLQTTAMTKSYKVPLLLAVYRDGRIQPEAPESAIAASFRAFYEKTVHAEDMRKDAATRDYRYWTDKDWVSLAMRNPVSFLLKTESGYFEKDQQTGLFCLSKRLAPWLDHPGFVQLFLDIVTMRSAAYCRDRLQKREREWYGDGQGEGKHQARTSVETDEAASTGSGLA
jgi:superfamily II DNA or RNA helicase/HKD family nuclease